MHRVTSLFLAALASIVFAVPSPRSTHVLHEKRAMEPVDWMRTSRLDPDRILPMRFGLSQQNLHLVEEMLASVSHPESPKYGQHYSAAEVVQTFKPSDETIEAVTNWLTDAGVSRDRLRLSINKGWIHVNASTAEVEDLLKAEYHVYTHPSGAQQIGDCLQKFIIQLCMALITFIVQDATIILCLLMYRSTSISSSLQFSSTTEQEQTSSAEESSPCPISSVAL